MKALDVEEAHRAEAWQELARVASLAAILDLDNTCVPLSTSSDDGLDRSLLLLLDSLHAACVQVAIITRRPERLVERMKAQTPHAWWFSDVGASLAEVRERLPGVRVIAIGDDDAFPDLRVGEDLAFGVRSAESACSSAQLILRGRDGGESHPEVVGVAAKRPKCDGEARMT